MSRQTQRFWSGKKLSLRSMRFSNPSTRFQFSTPYPKSRGCSPQGKIRLILTRPMYNCTQNNLSILWKIKNFPFSLVRRKGLSLAFSEMIAYTFMDITYTYFLLPKKFLDCIIFVMLNWIAENLWTTNNLLKDTQYVFRSRAENEYGFSAYSNNSIEYEFQSYTVIVWASLPILAILGISGLLVIYYSEYYCIWFIFNFISRQGKFKEINIQRVIWK